MTSYKITPLFGGALLCDLPEKFADVSKIRQVPSNQEVYIDKDGFTSIIFDITERVGPKSSSSATTSNLETDGRALTTHLEELVGDDADTVKVWNTTETSFSHLDHSIPAYTLIATQTPNKPKPKAADDPRSSGGGAPDFTALILTLLRLEKEQTDVLITINVPHIKGEYDEDEVDLELGKQGKLIGDAVEYAARIWSSLDVEDWGLFNEV
ncbi:hypothetical protein B0T18DRAFT_427872 [Schizothecium vesticola]|uniref:Mog1p/PsbP-like protein n=1 Tax=Schizothecium vesticola TaxID=314040 RepID=A0AA40F2D6_9PEZI|nr:hypothetical protein B0T18DRAFT_427872 [Schizothecium vesticola]